MKEKNNELMIMIANKGKFVANKCLKHFFELCELNSDAFSHLFDISIRLSNTYDGSSGKYSVENNYIILDIDYLVELVELYVGSNYDEKVLNNVILNVALVIIHETIHADRVVMIDNSINSINIDSGSRSSDVTLVSDNYLGIESDKSKIEDRLANMYGFEEIMTEAIATIIVFARDDKELDFDGVCDRILNSKGNYDDIKVAVKFLKNMGIDTVKWFLTSVYGDYYVDELEMVFKDRYDDLLYDFNDIYEASLYGDEPSEYSLRDIDDIVNNRSR